jgi:hypothetical protein
LKLSLWSKNTLPQKTNLLKNGIKYLNIKNKGHLLGRELTTSFSQSTLLHVTGYF